MADEHRLATVIPALLDLGLTRLEAEVYLACLELSGEGPVSSYRVAQAMGRDPANAGKVLNALVKHTAVRVVQQKPRLYLPQPLAEFSERILDGIRARRDEAVRRLATLEAPAVDGVALALCGREQVIDRARALLAGCRSSALVCGSGDAVRDLGRALEDAAADPARDIAVLSPLAFASETVRIVTMPADLPRPGGDGAAWLHLVVDDAHWLTAAADAGRPEDMDGWWCTASSAAPVLAAVLRGALQSADTAENMIETRREMHGLQAALHAAEAALADAAITAAAPAPTDEPADAPAPVPTDEPADAPAPAPTDAPAEEATEFVPAAHDLEIFTEVVGGGLPSAGGDDDVDENAAGDAGPPDGDDDDNDDDDDIEFLVRRPLVDD